MTNNKPLLSVVVVSRNDDHGGNLLQRMQLFVSGWLEQAKRHNLDSELIIVEWNPLPDRTGLSEALKWPENNGPCTVRFIEVPNELHMRFKYSERLALFQMIGKNVGIRRARGRFILATNIDVLFSDKLMEFFTSGQLSEGYMYRIDRYDVPSDIPERVSIEEQLTYCRNNIIRINAKGSTIIPDASAHPTLLQLIVKRLKSIKSIGDVGAFSRDTILFFYTILIRPFMFKNHLHTNACGDFTLMARKHWFELRGNAEFETFSMHLDGLMCAVAHYSGVEETILPDPMRIYHIEHAPGSGWSPGVGAKILDDRLKSAGIPQITYKEYLKLVRKIRSTKGPTIYNDANWGLGQESLKTYDVMKADWDLEQ